ncbi:hypothetical protein B0H19DRAFT_1066802 [Mycena capillaripes]|nr:hypothetical protein B0H19DRAFT_1066802 [Mycena capillaripes]
MLAVLSLTNSAVWQSDNCSKSGGNEKTGSRLRQDSRRNKTFRLRTHGALRHHSKPSISHLSAVSALLASGFAPTRTAFGFDEEGGGVHTAGVIATHLEDLYGVGQEKVFMIVDEAACTGVVKCREIHVA